MKKSVKCILIALSAVSVFCSSCTQNRVTITNSAPKSKIHYTDPDGREYIYAVFWTRIVNRSAETFKIAIDFPSDPVQISSSPVRLMKFLVPADTMTTSKEPFSDYGLNIENFLDQNRNTSFSLKRTVNPGDSTAFYIVVLSDPIKGDSGGGMLRPALSLRKNDLFYTMSVYTPSKQTLILKSHKEIPCGKITFN